MFLGDEVSNRPVVIVHANCQYDRAKESLERVTVMTSWEKLARRPTSLNTQFLITKALLWTLLRCKAV